MNMKKFLAAFLSAAMVVTSAAIPVFAEEETDTWNGSKVEIDWYDEGQTEFTINSAAQLAGLAQLVNDGNGFHGKTVNLGINIDLNNEQWTPIGIVETASFRGTFDGQQHTISNLTITNGGGRNGIGLGLFGDLGVNSSDTNPSVGTIQNLTINNATISGTGNIGAFVGGGAVNHGRQNGGNIKNCKLTGNVNIFANQGRVGGIAGYIPGENNDTSANIENCTVEASEGSVIDGNGNIFVGGILGYTGSSYSTIKGCTVSGVTISGSKGVGGIIGTMNSKNIIQDCSVNDITVNSTQDDGTAGLIAGQIYSNGSSAETIPKMYNCSAEESTVTAAGQPIEDQPLVGQNGRPVLVGEDVVLDDQGKIKSGEIEIQGSFSGTINQNELIASDSEGNVTVKNGGFDENGDLVSYVAMVGEDGYATLDAALAAITDDVSTINLLKNVALNDAAQINNSVTIKGAPGITITRATGNTGTFFTVEGGKTLTLDGVTLDAGGKWSLNEEMWQANKAISLTDTAVYDTDQKIWLPAANDPITPGGVTTTENLIQLNGNSNLTLTGGTVIQNIYATTNIHVIGAGTTTNEINIADATIKHFAGTDGSLIITTNGSGSKKITLGSQAVLTGNYNLRGNGGLFYLNSTGDTLTMEDGAQVTYNKGVDCNGTFVMTRSGATFTMKGGKISGNEGLKSTKNGYCQPIYAHLNGNFTMNGGEICENTGCYVGAFYQRVDNTGGTTNGQVRLNGGSIHDNHYYEDTFPSNEHSLGQVFLTGDANIGDDSDETKMEITGDVTFYGQAKSTVASDSVIEGSVSVMSEQYPGYNPDANEGVVIEGEVTENLYAQKNAEVDNKGHIGGNVVILPDDPTDSQLADGEYQEDETAVVDGRTITSEATDRVGNMTVTMTSMTSFILDEEANNKDSYVETYSLHAEAITPGEIGTTPEKNREDENDQMTYADIYICEDGVKVERDFEDNPQTLSIKIGEPVDTDKGVYVYHFDGSKWEEITPIAFEDGVVTFEVTSLSPFGISYTALPLTEDEIATKITAELVPTGESNEYNIVLKGSDADGNVNKINRFMSAEFAFNLEIKKGHLAYTVEPGDANISIVAEDGVYEFNMDGINKSGMTGEEIMIGKVKFAGEGEGTFQIKPEGAIVNTAEDENNIVAHFTTSAANLEINPVQVNVSVHTKKVPVTINVMFPNNIVPQGADYTAMSVNVKGGVELKEDKTFGPIDKTIKLGNKADSAVTWEDTFTAYDGANGYSIKLDLPKGYRYTFTFSGEGYRTFSHDVIVDDTKTITVWNNAMDSTKTIIEGSVEDRDKFDVTFLAGDIVEDNTINLYDLSSVVAYFGHDGLTDGDGGGMDKYIQYDLNRDGQIDSKDIAMVLVSWGK